MKLKLVFAFLVLITTASFGQSEVEGSELKLIIEKEAGVIAEQTSNDQIEDAEEMNLAKDESARINFRATLKDLRRDLKDNLKAQKSISKEKKKSSNGGSSSVPLVLLIILAILLPWLAVGLYTDWDLMLTLITFLLWLLAFLPGIIFAFLVIFGVIG